MTILSLERVDVLTGTVKDLSRSAQLSMSLANMANNKGFVEVAKAATQDSFLQTVLALHSKGKVEQKFLFWLSSCLQHEAFVIFAEADFVPSLLELWRLNYVRMTHRPQLVELLQVAVILYLHTIAEIFAVLPTINKHCLSVLLHSILKKQKNYRRGNHLILPRVVLFMEFAQDLWLDYGIELSIEHFLTSWLSLSEGRTGAIERVVFHLLSRNNAINSQTLHQILHILVLVTLSIKEMQIGAFKHRDTKEGFWFSSQELERLLERFIFDESFLLLASKVNVMDFHMPKPPENRNSIDQLFLHWANSNTSVNMDRLLANERNFDLTFEQLVKYLPPFVLTGYDMMAHRFTWSQNIRTVYPFLTQKEAHIFSNHEYVELRGYNSGDESVYYIWSAIVKNLGGNANLALAVYLFRGENTDDLAFWDSVIRFCIANQPVLEQYFQNHANTYANLFGYLSHKRQEEGNRFDMKGRSLRVVMQQAEEWYAAIHRRNYGNHYNANLSWIGAAYQPYEWVQAESVYTITQLTNNAALQAESNVLHHCVSGYGSRCASGNCSIWSLRVSIDGGQSKSLVTIEIDSSHNIVQAKSASNAQPNASHLAILKEWAAQECLVFVRC